MNKDTETIIMNLIAGAGSARSYAMEAIKLARRGQIEQAMETVSQASQEILLAHNSQTRLIQNEAKGSKTEVGLLMVHAQDLIMDAMVVRDLADEFIEIYRRLGNV